MFISNKGAYKLKIYEIATGKIIYNSDLKDQTYIDKLKSSLFKVINGHIYSNNDVMKLRYDLLESSPNITQDQFINFYTNLFQNCQISSAFTL